MTVYSQHDSAITRGENGAASQDADQLDLAGQAVLKLLHRAAGAAEANADKHWRQPKSFLTSFALPKIELRS